MSQPTPPPLRLPPPRARGMSAPARERAFAALLSSLERLADALAAPVGTRQRRSTAELKPLVCGLVASLRAAGATPDEVVARLTAFVADGTPGGVPPRQTRARVAAVVRWCEEVHPRNGTAPVWPTNATCVPRCGGGVG